MLKFNENNEVIRQDEYKAILVGLQRDRQEDISYSMKELKGLAEAANAEVLGMMTQNLERPNTATLIGKGKVEELAEMVHNMEADTVIFNDELSGMQLRNLEDALEVRVIDRTILILDIFADRASSREGKLQVELAQLQYRMPRLIGFGKSLSRLGGGIGTRGPGETKLESDKRHIRRRIKSLEEEFEALEKRRGLARARREKDGVETVVIVGYTNAGKSTLMNALTQAGVLAQDKLFATLDPTSRALTLPDGRKVMLIDTVGFIRRLPHHLVEAFKSTLEEAVCAKVILNVCDASDPECSEHIEVTKELLNELGCSDKPIVTVFNKCDLPDAKGNIPFEPNSVMISALNETGFDALLEAVAKALPPTRARAKMLIPYSDGGAAAIIRKDSVINFEEYRENGLYFELVADVAMIDRYQDYCV